MEKTYKLIENPIYMAADQIYTEYDGYWIYITNAEFTDEKEFIGGIPVVLGKKPYDGAKDGIYEKYRNAEYGKKYELLRHCTGFRSSVHEITFSKSFPKHLLVSEEIDSDLYKI